MLWNSFRLAVLIGASCLTLMLSAAAKADRNAIQEVHRGVAFVAIEARADASQDSPPVPPKKALQILKDAHDVLFARSAAAAAAIDRLKQAGDVVIVYDPAFPSRALTSRTIAAFFPGYLNHNSDRHTSLVVVGRYGIHWPLKELAVVLAHELLGHGIQHLEGRIWKARTLDIECEAFLWTERAYQDLGVDKRRHAVIDMRRQIERHWCRGFILWSATHQPAINKHWQAENPDIDALAAGFARYAESLKANKDAQEAVEAATRVREVRDPAIRAKLAKSEDPDEIFAASLAYLRDRTSGENLQEAARLMEKAARLGHADAQYRLGMLLYREMPGSPRTEAARQWLTRAAENGHRRAAAVLRLLPGS